MTKTPVPAARRRVLCLWLLRLAVERPLAARRRNRTGKAPEASIPWAAWERRGNRQLIVAANPRAEAAGVRPGLALADGRALLPMLATIPRDGAADGRALARLAQWCRRFSPWTAPFGDGTALESTGIEPAGIRLEITGCAHLFGGEDALARAATGRLARAGFTALAGIAGNPGAALALARAAACEDTPAIAAPGEERAALAPLPVAALDLGDAILATLDGLGIRLIGDLYPLLEGSGRAAVAQRFPPHLLATLDKALGRSFEPLGTSSPRPTFVTRFELPEPARHREATAAACTRLVGELCRMLEHRGLGARRAAFSAFRSDGHAERVEIGTARPVADADVLGRLFALKLETIDAGPGIDGFACEALQAEPLRRSQRRLAEEGPENGAETRGDDGGNGVGGGNDAALAPLIDRLGGRFGVRRVGRIALRANHLPERAQGFAPAAIKRQTIPGPAPQTQTIPGPAGPLARPLRLLTRPEAIEAPCHRPDGPPAWFTWRDSRHQVARAEGPERIALDWWTLPGWQANPCRPGAPPGLGTAIRDYWRVEDAGGLRFWIYRAGPEHAPESPGAPARWYLHGVFP